MPLLSLTRFLAAIVSAALLAAAGYLLWTWYQGEWTPNAQGLLVQVREPWRLWTGAGLLAWSFLGRLILPLVLAKSGGRPSRARRGQGQQLGGASGSLLNVERHGPAGAPILLFTHGWGMDLTFWDYAKQDLGNRFQLVLWDLPGLGRSKPPASGEISVANFATDLRGLLETLERPAVLVGHSIGGMTLQTLVRDHPDAMDRVAGLVLLNTTYTNPLRTMILSRLLLALQKPLLEPMTHLTIWLQPLVWLSKWQSYLSGSVHAGMRLGFGKFVTASQLEHAALLATRAPPAIEAKGDLAMFHWDATGALGRSRKPLLVIGGDRDIVTKLEASRAIAAEAGGAELRVVDGVNHMGPLERADLYNDAIAAFALSVQPSATRDRPPPSPLDEPPAFEEPDRPGATDPGSPRPPLH
ncbi:MAG: alpha/beta hydrolase [Phenylobacterium sp.]|nr:alpha/beta hydrolase [Phenylobacterium sp.]